VIVLGCISGSSLDGLDIAICRLGGDRITDISWEVLAHKTVPFSPTLETQLSQAADCDARTLLQIEVSFTRFCAEQIKAFIAQKEISPDYIAAHGHTVYHAPDKGYSLQIGQGALLAALTGVPSIVDFRSGDVALGGEGAPLAPIVEQILLDGHDFYLNLGGIANISAHYASLDVISMDVCPCNQVLNHLANQLGHKYDNDGAIARRGIADKGLIKRWQSIEYFSADPPKSMDNTWVKEIFIRELNHYALSTEDALASAVSFISNQIALDLRKIAQLPIGSDDRTMLISGGGAFNGFLIESLSAALEDDSIALVRPNDDIINYKEAILMALMGYLRIAKLPSTLPTVTGAALPLSAGAVYLPA
jgi:Predicted molecular chaperone distantly related to HSP70-fold metalloproteases